MGTWSLAALLVVAAVVAASSGWYVWHRRALGQRQLTRAGGDRRQTGPSPGDADPALAPIDLVLAEDDTASVERSPGEMVMAWADGRMCVACGGELLESRLHHIALLEPGGMTREWVDIAADRLPLALATCLPMCWNCHVAATFRRLHPELVTDREEPAIHSDLQDRK